MLTITYYDKRNPYAGLESVSTPAANRAYTIADALRECGYSVRIWRTIQGLPTLI